MRPEQAFSVDGYQLDGERMYDPATHFWVEERDAGRARIGFDPLGSETAGDVVAISFEPIGAAVARGEPFGQLEAAKFVGPLIAPVSGSVTAHNAGVLSHPGLVNDDPLSSWLVELELASPDELALLLRGEEPVAAWFRAEVERFRRQGAIAE